MKITAEMLYSTAEEATRLWLSTLPDDSSLPEPKYSLRFKWKMRKLFRRVERTSQSGRPIFYVKRAVVITTAAMVVVFSMLMSVQAYREKVIDTIVNIFHELTQYRFVNETEHQEDLPEIAFGYIPEGMSLTANDRYPNQNYILYEAKDGSYFELIVTRSSNQIAHEKIVDSADAVVKDMIIRGNSTAFYSKNGEQIIFWVEGNAIWRLLGNVDAETLATIAENLITLEKLQNNKN